MLSSRFPGTTAAPESPPASAASRESRRRLPSCFSGPWQLTQFLTSVGRTASSKNLTSSGANDSSAPVADSSAQTALAIERATASAAVVQRRAQVMASPGERTREAGTANGTQSNERSRTRRKED